METGRQLHELTIAQAASCAKASPLAPKGNDPDPSAADAATRDLAAREAAHAGLELDDRCMAIVLETAPYAIAMADRMRKPRDRMDEPSLVFRFTSGKENS